MASTPCCPPARDGADAAHRIAHERQRASDLRAVGYGRADGAPRYGVAEHGVHVRHFDRVPRATGRQARTGVVEPAEHYRERVRNFVKSPR